MYTFNNYYYKDFQKNQYNGRYHEKSHDKDKYEWRGKVDLSRKQNNWQNSNQIGK